MKKIKLSNGNTIRFKMHAYTHEAKISNNNEYVMSIEVQKENLVLFFAFCKKYSLHGAIFYGTLLGAIRDRDFIKHDDDVDIVMRMEELDIFFTNIEKLKEIGFKITRYDRRGLVSITRKGEYMDLYFSVKKGAARVITEMYVYPASMIENLEEINFLGFKVPAPVEHVDFFLYEYGETWTTPIRYEETRNSVFFAKMKHVVKGILPDNLVLAIQRKIGNSKQEDFMNRYRNYCSQNAISATDGD